MAKKHNGLVLLGVAALGVAAGAYLYLKKTDADRFDDDDFDDFDDFDQEKETKEVSKRSYVPLNLDGTKSEAAQAEKTTGEKSGGEAEPFDEEDEEPIDKEDAPVRTTAMSGVSETVEEFFDEEDEVKEDRS